MGYRDSFEYTITVQPTPVIADKEITICDGDTFEILPTDDSPTEIVPLEQYTAGLHRESRWCCYRWFIRTNETSISQSLSNLLISATLHTRLPQLLAQMVGESI